MSHRRSGFSRDISLLFLLLWSLVACGSNAPAADDQDADAASTSASAATAYGINTTVRAQASPVAEGDSGDTILLVQILLSPRSYSVVFVDYMTIDVSATAGVDYRPVRGQLKFDPGVLSQTIEIPVIGDQLKETDETFRLVLGIPGKAKVGNIKYELTVLDDD